MDGELLGLEQPADDPPDIMCQSISERGIAFELKEWLSEGQMAEAQRREGVEQIILAAIAPLLQRDAEYRSPLVVSSNACQTN
jgi:hypothetical protein